MVHDSPIKHSEKTTIIATYMELVLTILRWVGKKKAILHVISYRWILKATKKTTDQEKQSQNRKYSYH